MVTALKKYNLDGQEIGQVEVVEGLATATANGQMIKDYIVALRNNARQWSACTKTRAEVKHTTAKPHPQKRTGRARQGMLSTPQYRGGGIVFGPKPKFDQHVRINRKERLKAIQALIAEKIKANQVIILDIPQMDEPKTKTVNSFLKLLGIKGRPLFLTEGTYQSVEVEEEILKFSVADNKNDNFKKSIRNIPKAECAIVKNISGYDVILASHLIISANALEELIEWLGLINK